VLAVELASAWQEEDEVLWHEGCQERCEDVCCVEVCVPVVSLVRDPVDALGCEQYEG
jgi:hypothetical protein